MLSARVCWPETVQIMEAVGLPLVKSVNEQLGDGGVASSGSGMPAAAGRIGEAN